jgi:squalene-hopene/tetraprenyl-beta-curcumene cyclase
LDAPAGGRYHWDPPSRGRIAKACESILERQLADGGFNIYRGGPAELNATIKAYCALKLAGHSPDSEPLRRARRSILELGGLQGANSYVKINLSLFGLYPRQHAPSVPPEIVLLPGNVLYEMSSWTRSILVPLSIVQARGSNRRAPTGFELDELLLPGVSMKLPKRNRLSVLFHHLDRVFKVWEKRGSQRIRDAAIRQAEHWILERTRFTEGLGAIYPAMMYFIMALDALGYPKDHPDLADAVRHFESLLIETPHALHVPALPAAHLGHRPDGFRVGRGGRGDDARMTRAADWLLSKEVRRKGDWSVKRPDTEPSGWAFEFANEFYPDIDDTAQVLLALLHAKASDPQAQAACERRAINWLLAMQSEDGGWAAFDVDNNWAVLNQVPFADHNAMLDPTCPDITGRVLESLCRRGLAESRCRAPRRGLPFAGAGEGRKLVRPLGRQLYLRLVPGHARSGRKRRAGRTRRGESRARTGCGRFRIPMADGAKAAPATIATTSCRRPVALRKPPGRCWACWRRTATIARRCGVASSFCWSGGIPMARGRKTRLRAPASPRFSI